MTLLDFYSKDCAPCRNLDRDLQTIGAKTQLNIQRIDIMTNYYLVEKYGIMKVPTLLVLSNGEILAQMVGYKGFDSVATFIQDSYNPLDKCVQTLP